MRRAAVAVACSPLLLLGACDYQNYQSVFAGAGRETQQFLNLFTIFLVVCTIMYVLVIAFLMISLLRRRRAEANVVESGNHHRSHPLMRNGLIAWAALVSIGLVALAIASFFTDRSMAAAAANEKLSNTRTANPLWWDNA